MESSMIWSHMHEFSFYLWKLDVWADFMTRQKLPPKEVFNTQCHNCNCICNLKIYSEHHMLVISSTLLNLVLLKYLSVYITWIYFFFILYLSWRRMTKKVNSIKQLFSNNFKTVLNNFKTVLLWASLCI